MSLRLPLGATPPSRSVDAEHDELNVRLVRDDEDPMAVSGFHDANSKDKDENTSLGNVNRSKSFTELAKKKSNNPATQSAKNINTRGEGYSTNNNSNNNSNNNTDSNNNNNASNANPSSSSSAVPSSSSSSSFRGRSGYNTLPSVETKTKSPNDDSKTAGSIELTTITTSTPEANPFEGENHPHEGSSDNEGDGHTTAQPRPAKEWPSVLADGWKAYLTRSFHDVFLTTWMNLLLIAIPFAVISYFANWGDAPTFIFSLLALCPLAERISFVTDEVCKYTNPTVAGLVSATMGNVTELIVSLVACAKGLLIVVQVSLIGSIVSNLLLVLGTAFLLGGFKYQTQTYSKSAAATNTGLLILSVMGLMFPMVLIHTNDDSSQGNQGELALSRITAICLLLIYIALVYYQLKTHRALFEEQEEDDEDEEPPVLGFWGAIVWALVITFFIGILSEFIVGAIQGAASQMGMPILFISTILLPIVGNAAEHASAVIFALRNKMDISLGIAVGSATQISLFVIPFSTLFAWWIGQPLSLDFAPFETAVVLITVIMVSMVLQQGSSDWLRGLMLIVAYIVIAASHWVANPPADLS